MKNQFPDLTYVLSFHIVLGHWQPYCSVIFHYFFLPPLYALILFDRIKGAESCMCSSVLGWRKRLALRVEKGFFFFNLARVSSWSLIVVEILDSGRLKTKSNHVALCCLYLIWCDLNPLRPTCRKFRNLCLGF